MSLAVAILFLPSLVLWILISIGVVVRLLGGAADRDLDHRNSPGRTPKCSREPASQAGFRLVGTGPAAVTRTSDSPQVARRAAVSSPDTMRRTRMTGWLLPLVTVALALALGGGARAGVCIVVNPVLEIGCR